MARATILAARFAGQSDAEPIGTLIAIIVRGDANSLATRWLGVTAA